MDPTLKDVISDVTIWPKIPTSAAQGEGNATPGRITLPIPRNRVALDVRVVDNGILNDKVIGTG